jgi:hypothetical protein
MSVTVGRLTSEVAAKPSPKRGEEVKSAPPSPQRELERLRAAQARLRRDALRTRAEGFDD